MIHAVWLAALLTLPADPYPVGVTHGQAIRGREFGWLDLTHRVDRLPSGLYRYRVTLTYRGSERRVVVLWDALPARNHRWETERGPLVIEWHDSRPPVWRYGRIYATGFREGALATGAFWQGCPMPRLR